MKRTVLSTAILAVFAGAALADDLSIRAEFSDTRPGNIAFTPDGRLILTQQPLDGPQLRVVEVLEDGSKVPFPTQDWSDGPETGEVGIAATIGVKSDSNGVVWILDMGGENTPARFIAWDSQANALHKIIDIPRDVLTPISFVQDFALDEANGKLYIADMTFTAPASATKPAFIVVDMDSGEARRVLEADPMLMANDHDVIVNENLVGFKDDTGAEQPWHLPFNAISIDPEFDHVYFGTMNGTDVFRIPTAALADPALDNAALSASIERYGDKAPNDGFIVDGAGRVLSGDVERNAVTVTTADGFEVVAQDDSLLQWPDGFAFAPDGGLYVVANQLNTHPALNMGEDGSDHRYYILKIAE